MANDLRVTLDIGPKGKKVVAVAPDWRGLERGAKTRFDDVRVRVSAEMQKGPRGRGRDRDHIVRHTLGTEQEWAVKLGVHTPQGALLTDEGLQAHRDAYRQAIRAFHSDGKMVRTWPLRYLMRHTAYHTLDHAWEMEDKDLSVSSSRGHVEAGHVPPLDAHHRRRPLE